MKRWGKLTSALAIAGVALTITALVPGNSKTQALEETAQRSNADNAGKLIVHEWGTFTSFSGSNGVQLDFRPLINEDLPEFVLDRHSQTGISVLSKRSIRARVRMETPVTYFYTDRERTVRAEVEFPEGLLTEFYPPVVALAPAYNPKNGNEPFGNSMLDWGEIDLIPAALLAPQVKDAKTRNWLQGLIEARVAPHQGNANHYYHARETDSAFVHVRRSGSADPMVIKPTGDFIEKFLFYRGVGRFEQPLKVEVADDGRVKVTNPGLQPIRSLFQVTVAGKSLTLSVMDQLSAESTAEFPASAESVNLQQLQDRVVQALVAENLYPREATAMVKTWTDSWFTEEGTRIFYMVPRETTDKLLPLTISPAPDESVRVLVGRVEVLSPAVEKDLMKVVSANAKRRAELTAERVKTENPQPVQLPVPAELLKLGRLVEPALVRIRELAPDESVSGEAEILIRQCREVLDAVAVAR